MTEQGRDKLGGEYKRKSNDFRFGLLDPDNCVCGICHGIGATLAFRYVLRNYEGKRGKICKTLQAHERSFWICSKCLANLKTAWKKAKIDFDDIGGTGMTKQELNNIRAMIEKECIRFSLVDLCNDWGVTTEQFYEFLDAAVQALQEEQG